jgi:hypothetical protein
LPSASPSGLPDGSPDAFDREFVLGDTPNVRTGFDIAASDNVPLALSLFPGLSTPAVKVYFTKAFTIGPLQTASVNLLPNLSGGQVLLNEKLEIRGTVELVRRPFRREFWLGAPPVDVLVTPEIRGTFLDNNFTGAATEAALDFDQINYGLPVASGKGRNTVEGLDPLVADPTIFQPDLIFNAELREDMIANFNEQLSGLGLVVQPTEQATPAP